MDNISNYSIQAINRTKDLFSELLLPAHTNRSPKQLHLQLQILAQL
jgi:hypothetical protein